MLFRSASVYSVQISNLVAGQNYQVGVRAVNSAGAGSATLVNTLSAIVEDAPTPAPAPVVTTVPQTPTTTIPSVVSRPQPTVTTPSTTVPARPVPTTVPAQVVTTTVPALAVLPGSGGIATQPGDAVAIVDGKVKEVEIVTEGGSTKVSLGGDFVLRITPSSDQMTSTSLTDENQLAVVTGSTVSFTGEGFAPNTTVNVWLNSTPILLGTAQVDADGKFDSEFAIPAELAGGHHTLTFVGISAKGSEVRTSVGVVIVEQGDVGTTSDGDVTITELEPSGGPDMSILVVLGLVLFISTAMIFGRRRRKGQTPRSNSEDQR